MTSSTASIRVTLAGATGWAGSALARGIAAATDLQLVSAVSRSHAGGDLAAILDMTGASPPIHATAGEALAAAPDVFVEYTLPGSAKAHVLAALSAGAHVVVGTSGLSDADYDEIATAADAAGRGVLACGNFAITAVLLMKFSEIAARWIESREVVDYASAGKRDAPSGTVRELVGRLDRVGASRLDVPLDDVQGEPGTRGARLGGTQVHSVRLPGYVIGVESLFGSPDERLSIRHDAGSSAEPYVAGALLAIREVGGLTGLHRGLDSVMDLG